ncbi:hypothetical protein [Sporosarcina sp. FSL W7-1283]|uniref:hypothetical protein n=1 Tax=Sporosarcina sp. FSL W7-1283 TaxID=2921560 RepID=UPI0030F95A62
MNLWIGDYFKLRNEIHYLEFKLTDDQLANEDRKETQAQLDKLLMREGEFKVILNSFEDLDSQILKMKYIEGMTLEAVAKVLGYSANYIYTEHSKIMKVIKKFELIHSNLEQFKKNFSIR